MAAHSLPSTFAKSVLPARPAAPQQPSPAVADQAAKLRALAAQVQGNAPSSLAPASLSATARASVGTAPARPSAPAVAPRPALPRVNVAPAPSRPAAAARPAPIAAQVPPSSPAQPAVARATVIAVTSGKGGVGKTNVSVNLAITLAQAGKRVILLDADLGLANADVLLNVDVKSNLAHVVARQRSLDEVMVDAPGGVKLIAGASGLAKMADLSDVDRRRIIAALGDLEARADVIVVDTGAGISPSVLAFARAADHVLVVTTPEPTAITDAYAAVKVLTKGGDFGPAAAGEDQRHISLLVNQALSEHEAAGVYARVAKVARQFLGATVYDAGHVLRDDAVTTAVRARTPFVLGAPRASATRCIQRLAMRLGHASAAGPSARGGFFDRMGRRFLKG